MRFRWSEISTGSPGAIPCRRPPAALVSTTILAPAATAVRMLCTTAATPRPSYRWVRPSSTSARLSPIGIDRIRPEWPATVGRRETGQCRHFDVGGRRAEPVGRRHPAGAHDQGDIVVQHAGGSGQRGRRCLGVGPGIGSCDRRTFREPNLATSLPTRTRGPRRRWRDQR